MYIPPSFLETNPATLFEFMERHSFATVVSQVEGDPIASHLPLLIDRSIEPHGRLIGHMARANSHWQSAANRRVLVLFQGPHAYVSPGWIDATNVVPTWNYVAVHAYGTLRLIEDRDRLSDIVQRTVCRYESNRSQPWSVSVPDADFLERLLAAIVGFEIDVERIEGKWKLNQNHPPERRDQIIQGLRQTGRHDELEIAELMAAARQPSIDK